MLSGHTLTKTVRQWGLVIAMGVAGFAAGIAVFTLIGRDGIVHALNAPRHRRRLGLSVLLSLAFLAIGALVAVAQERWRNLLARIALNNMTQGLSMFDAAGPAGPLQHALYRNVSAAAGEFPEGHADA